MTYVISDIHGEYAKFTQMLEKIKFNDRDVMYVLGNSLDYGDESIELLNDLTMRYNILSIAGKHEYRAAKLFRKIENMLKNNTALDIEDKQAIADMMENGGEKTIKDFTNLDEEMREGILDYLADLPLYEEIDLGQKSYLLVSSGIADFKSDTSFDDYMPEDFINEPLDASKKYFDDKTIIAGSTRTSEVTEDKTDKIFYGNGSIFINCGVAAGGKLACLCLENGKEYYI